MRWIRWATLWRPASLALVACVVPLQFAPAQTPPAPAPRLIAVLDAAHGGDDPGGKLAGGQPEKAATLALSIRLRSLLTARGFQVVTTRESDVTLDNDSRAAIANHARAQLCLTLHAAESGSGIHMFTSSLAVAKSARFSAWKTAQAGWVNRSLALAGVLNAALLQAGFNVTLDRTSLPGIDSMICPAVAVEIAPERNSDHAIIAGPDDPTYQARVADAIAAAAVEWSTEGHQP